MVQTSFSTASATTCFSCEGKETAEDLISPGRGRRVIGQSLRPLITFKEIGHAQLCASESQTASTPNIQTHTTVLPQRLFPTVCHHASLPLIATSAMSSNIMRPKLRVELGRVHTQQTHTLKSKSVVTTVPCPVPQATIRAKNENMSLEPQMRPGHFSTIPQTVSLMHY